MFVTALILALVAAAPAQSPDLRKAPKPKRFTPVSESTVRRKIGGTLKYGGTPYEGPWQAVDSKLTPRKPHIAGRAGLDVDFPINWSTRESYVQFKAYAPGKMGTLAYLRFVPPSSGQYLVVTRFIAYGQGCQARLILPDTTASANGAGPNQETALVGLLEAANTSEIWLGLHFRADTEFAGGYWHSTEFIKI
jgi:hypothetical protein